MGRSIRRRSGRKTLIIVIATILVLLTLFPYYYMVVQSLAPWTEVDKTLVLTRPTFRSYQYLLDNGGSRNRWMWIRALGNSLLVTSISSIIAVSIGILTGYAIIKLKFRGYRVFYNVLLFQMFFPAIIMLVPIYILMRPLANTYPGMILPTCVSLWAVFMFINYFKTLPDELFEAARLDGASELRILRHITFPISLTISVIVFLTLFMARWSELMWDMLIAPALQMQTLNVLITTQFKPMGNLPGPLYAASVILTLPIVVLLLSFSRYFREGLSFHLK